jgi:hypothetical protein
MVQQSKVSFPFFYPFSVSTLFFQFDIRVMTKSSILTKRAFLVAIAVSKPFTTSSTPVPVWPDFEVHVMTIPGLGQHMFHARDDKPRVVTLMAGKLKVALLDEEDFLIGEMGMFRIEQGQSCKLTNPLYRDVPIQIIVAGERD